ncbi:unnamed protein product [Hydatigera taeniaeformis]|uniref:RxLR effector protein n=1 Tax=Hydatigena taeniaeformis TaxID=6205 RepID=A0A0R3WXA7_HYDTA|nr:unnamed protein product [Hydatigera taeniaeformis]
MRSLLILIKLLLLAFSLPSDLIGQAVGDDAGLREEMESRYVLGTLENLADAKDVRDSRMEDEGKEFDTTDVVLMPAKWRDFVGKGLSDSVST